MTLGTRSGKGARSSLEAVAACRRSPTQSIRSDQWRIKREVVLSKRCCNKPSPPNVTYCQHLQWKRMNLIVSFSDDGEPTPAWMGFRCIIRNTGYCRLINKSRWLNHLMNAFYPATATTRTKRLKICSCNWTLSKKGLLLDIRNHALDTRLK